MFKFGWLSNTDQIQTQVSQVVNMRINEHNHVFSNTQPEQNKRPNIYPICKLSGILQHPAVITPWHNYCYIRWQPLVGQEVRGQRP